MNSISTFSNFSDLSDNFNENSLARICLHQDFDGLQVMVIKMPGNYNYPAIRDNCTGLITFTILKGDLLLEIKENSKSTVAIHNLKTGNILCFPRSYWRKTSTGFEECIYIEHIENGFRPTCREMDINETL